MISFFLFGLVLNKVEIIVIVIFIIFLILLIIFSYFKVRNRVRKQLNLEIQNIQKITKEEKIEVIEYKCTRAICFSSEEYFFNNWFFLELDNGKILCLYENEWNDLRTLPNTHFELYVNEQIQSVFSSKTNPIGEVIQAIHFSDEIAVLIKEFLEKFSDKEIIDETFDNFLNEIERQVKA